VKEKETRLNNLHDLVTNTLTERVSRDEVETRDLLAAIKFLKDNGITASVEQSKPMADLQAKILPFSVSDADAASG
tara:strand:+ start:560 stop:787 length:228 start_codon:yes stop_codon:yes gene_type:complete